MAKINLKKIFQWQNNNGNSELGAAPPTTEPGVRRKYLIWTSTQFFFILTSNPAYFDFPMFRLTCWVCCTVLRQATRISGGCSPGSTSKLLRWYLGTWVCLGTFSHPGHLNLVGEPVPDPVPVTLHHDEVHLALIEIIIVLLKQCQCEVQVEVPVPKTPDTGSSEMTNLNFSRSASTNSGTNGPFVSRYVKN